MTPAAARPKFPSTTMAQARALSCSAQRVSFILIYLICFKLFSATTMTRAIAPKVPPYNDCPGTHPQLIGPNPTCSTYVISINMLLFIYLFLIYLFIIQLLPPMHAVPQPKFPATETPRSCSPRHLIWFILYLICLFNISINYLIMSPYHNDTGIQWLLDLVFPLRAPHAG